jgi:hypothetical protein
MLFREEKNETQNDQRTQINIVHKESVVQGLNNLLEIHDLHNEAKSMGLDSTQRAQLSNLLRPCKFI